MYACVQDGPEEKPCKDITDEEWSKMEQALQDLEKASKQAELLRDRQPKVEKRSKELKELFAKFEGVIDENKVVEVSLDSPSLRYCQAPQH